MAKRSYKIPKPSKLLHTTSHTIYTGFGVFFIAEAGLSIIGSADQTWWSTLGRLIRITLGIGLIAEAM